jgi:chromosome segregation ATPase
MTEVESLTVQILQQIRDELRTTREELSSRIDRANERIGQTNERIGQTNQSLGGIAGKVGDMATQLVFLVKHAKSSARRERRIEQDVGELKERVTRLEEHTGVKPAP